MPEQKPTPFPIRLSHGAVVLHTPADKSGVRWIGVVTQVVEANETAVVRFARVDDPTSPKVSDSVRSKLTDPPYEVLGHWGAARVKGEPVDFAKGSEAEADLDRYIQRYAEEIRRARGARR